MDNHVKQWYVVKTKPKKEKHVVHQLRRAGYHLFFPQMRGAVESKPLFPAYLFIHADLADPYHHRMVQFTRGVNYILGDLEGPQPIKEILVEALQEKTRNGLLIEQELLFKAGETVRVKKGILKDLKGIIERNESEQGRIRVLFKWLSSNMRALLKYTDLEHAA